MSIVLLVVATVKIKGWKIARYPHGEDRYETDFGSSYLHVEKDYRTVHPSRILRARVEKSEPAPDRASVAMTRLQYPHHSHLSPIDIVSRASTIKASVNRKKKAEKECIGVLHSAQP